MLILHYGSKKELKENVGQALNYEETSFFGPEFKTDGILTGSNRPSITGIRLSNGNKAREFFASVTMKNGLISKVS